MQKHLAVLDKVGNQGTTCVKVDDGIKRSRREVGICVPFHAGIGEFGNSRGVLGL